MSTPLSWVVLNEFGGTRVRVPVLALLLAFGCGEMGSESREDSTRTNAQPNTPSPVSTDPAPTNTTALTSQPGTTAITTSPPSSAEIVLPDITVTEPAPAPVPLNACTNVTGAVDAPMSRFVVRHTDAPPRVLYSWTTKEQIEELRTNPTLLTRSVSSDGEVGRAQGLIAGGTDPVSLLLNEERFANKRYAWTNPWATRLGWTGDDYGDRLLAITLRADAWVGQMTMEGDVLGWAFRDMQGNPVSQDEVLGNPERLAAVYFFDQRDMPECRFESRTQGQLYREYFILNEGMLQSWSAFTEEVKAELDSDLAALRRLLDTLVAGECESAATCWRDGVLDAWSNGPADGIVQSYIGGLAFPNDLYAPTRTNLARLIERLEAVPLDDEPLQHDVADRDNDAGAEALPIDAGATDVGPQPLGVDGGNLDMSGDRHDAGVVPR